MRTMKTGISTLLMAGIMLIISCSSSKNAPVVADHSTLKGNWVLNNVTYTGVPAGEKIKLTLLDEGNEACLAGSIWTLPNNGFGSYNITSSSCEAGVRNINWSYREENGTKIFQYKRLESGVKAKKITDGYKFTVASVDAHYMVLQSQVNFENSIITISYNFSKQ